MSDSPQVALKHWRTFGTSEWSHVKSGLLGLVLGSLLPVAIYYFGSQAWGFSAGVVLVLVWSVVIFTWHLRRTGHADVFSATTFLFACVKATAGLVSQNETLYFAWPSLENLVYGTTFFASALLGRPVLALYAERVYPIPANVRTSHTFRRAFLIVSAVWLCGHGIRGALRLWLLQQHFPREVFLLLDTILGWPINGSLVAFTVWFPLRELHRAGFMSVSPKPISTMDAVELVVEESAPTTV